MLAQDRNAFAIASLLESYIYSWGKSFPDCFLRAHWSILNLVRIDEDGTLFSTIRGRMDDSLGMDEDTCADRIRDLQRQDFIKLDGSRISSSTCIEPTEKLVFAYDKHVVESIQIFFSCASDVQGRSISIPYLQGGSELNKIFDKFFVRFGELWSESIYSLLKTSIGSPALRLKALRQIRTFPYWHILISAWKHADRPDLFKRKYLFVDDFHMEIYDRLNTSHKTTAGYVQDMINWGFLKRLSREDGVPRNKFAVKMHDNFHISLSSYFNAIVPLVLKLTEEVSALALALPSNAGGPGESATVVMLPRPLGENVSATSGNSASVPSAGIGVSRSEKKG